MHLWSFQTQLSDAHFLHSYLSTQLPKQQIALHFCAEQAMYSPMQLPHCHEVWNLSWAQLPAARCWPSDCIPHAWVSEAKWLSHPLVSQDPLVEPRVTLVLLPKFIDTSFPPIPATFKPPMISPPAG